MRPNYKNYPFCIYDIKNALWVLDCFDDPRLFETHEDAEKYRILCIDYNNSNYEVRNYFKQEGLE